MDNADKRTFLYSVYFTNSDTGYISSGGGIILKTINGGINWTAQTIETNTWLSSVYFPDANTGFAVGGYNSVSGGVIYKTTDGGTSWIAQTSGTMNDLVSVYFTDANTGYAVGFIGTILKTTNGGEFVEKTNYRNLQ